MTPNHFVVCEAISDRDVTIFDSGGGFVRGVSHEYLENWSGNALFISSSPLELPSKSSEVWLWESIAGLVLLFFLVALWIRRMGRSKQALLTIVFFASLSMLGCGVAEPSAKVAKPQLVIDSPKRELGNLERQGRLHEVSFSLRKVGKEDIEITKVLTSCSCMQGRLFATKIVPRSSVTLDVLLDCSSVGSKAANAIIECNGIPTAQLSVDWTVVTSLSAEPGSINGVELASGQSTDVELQLKGRNEVEWPLLQAKCYVSSELGLTAAARITGTKCIVSFQASKEIEAGTAKGSVEISIPGNDTVSLSVPFCVILNESLAVSPSKLFLTPANDAMSAQLLMSTEMPELLNGLELTWLGESRLPCAIEKEFQAGVCILTIRVDEVAVKGVTHLEIATASGFLKRLPVFFPSSPR